MKKVQYILGMIICCIIMFLSCSKSNDVSSSALLPELVQAEEIMYESPDSALHILQTMPIPQPSDKLQNATWALFMTQAKYKLYVGQSDSLINIASDYFIHQKNPQRKALVFYYKAALFKENVKIEDAQNYYLKAIDEVEKTDDYKLAYLIYAGLGDLYAYRSLTDYALSTYETAYKYAIKSNINGQVISSYMNLARIYGKKNNHQMRIMYYNKAIELAENSLDYSKLSAALVEMSNAYNKINDYDSALYYMQRALKIERLRPNKLGEQKFLSIAQIYDNQNKSDSAIFYYKKALSSSNIYTLRNAYIGLFYLLNGKGKYSEASDNLEKAWFYNDSIQKISKERALIEMQEKYDQQKVINERNELEIKKNRTIHKVLICLIVAICVIAYLIYVYQKRLLTKERMIQEAEKTINTKTIQIQENEAIIAHNQKRISDLYSQINKERDIQEQMEEQINILTTIQKQNNLLKEKNHNLQQEIERISFTLKEKSKEMVRLEILTNENILLHDRENFLVNQLIDRIDLLNNLRNKPKYIETHQWKKIIELINFLFYNYTNRLSKKIPTLTESDIQICCLIKLHLNNFIIATLLAISPASVTKRKMRLKERIMQEIGVLGDGQSLEIWLWDF